MTFKGMLLAIVNDAWSAYLCLKLLTSRSFRIIICNFVNIAVLAEGLAPKGAGSSVGTVMTKSGSHIHVVLGLVITWWWCSFAGIFCALHQNFVMVTVHPFHQWQHSLQMKAVLPLAEKVATVFTYLFIVAWWHHMGTQNWVKIVSVNCCLMAPSNYLTKCWLTIREVPLTFIWEQFYKIPQASITIICLKIIYLKFRSNLWMANESRCQGCAVAAACWVFVCFAATSTPPWTSWLRWSPLWCSSTSEYSQLLMDSKNACTVQYY